MKKFILKLTAIIMLILSAGCTTTEQTERSAYDIGYRDGFSDGKITSGNSNRFKNTVRYREETEYKQGWDAGFQKAKMDW